MLSWLWLHFGFPVGPFFIKVVYFFTLFYKCRHGQTSIQLYNVLLIIKRNCKKINSNDWGVYTGIHVWIQSFFVRVNVRLNDDYFKWHYAFSRHNIQQKDANIKNILERVKCRKKFFFCHHKNKIVTIIISLAANWQKSL